MSHFHDSVNTTGRMDRCSQLPWMRDWIIEERDEDKRGN